MRTGVIYTLIDPRTNLVRYVGQTVNPAHRLASHKYQWKRSKKLTYVNSWIKNLAKENLSPILEIIDEIEEDLLDSKETDYIKLFKSVGCKLCNHSEGGKGNRGFVPSEESKIKRRETCKTSVAWKEKHKKHSEIMKQKHKDGYKFGYSNLSEEKRKEIGRRHSKKLSVPVLCFDLDNNFICELESVRKTSYFLGIKHNNAIIDNLKGRIESYKGYIFKYKHSK